MYDLTIVGCGPVGAVAANLAASAGLSVAVVERSDDVFDLPRAIHFDGHIMRIFQQAGLAEQILAETRIWRRSTFYGADGLPIRVHDWPTEQVQGWDAHYLFYQPSLERILREGFGKFEGLDFRPHTEVIDVSEKADGVSVVICDSESGAVEEIKSRFVLGADGASSVVRSLSQISLIDNNFDEPWLVVDLIAEREIGIPDESEMFCDPRRPATRVPGPGHHHRWEFMLLPGESADDMQRPEMVQSLLSPWVTPDEVQILRSSVYRFHSLIAERWREGNVFLAGDAAHQTPPFLGQGLCHGIRDVQNLIWKFRAIIDGADAEPLLASYEMERRPHVAQIIEMSVASGRDICILDSELARERDVRIRAQEASGVRAATTFRGLPALQSGILGVTPGSGELFPQPIIRILGEPDVKMDDYLRAEIAVVTTDDSDSVRGVTEGFGVPLLVLYGLSESGGSLTEENVREWFDERGGRFAILRPDRYVYSVSATVEELEASLRDLLNLLRPNRETKYVQHC